MHFLKKNLNGSPFVGVFCATSDDFTIVPPTISKKEELEVKNTLETKILKITLANSSLIGVLGVMFGKKIVVPEIIEKKEKIFLEEHGLEVKQIHESSAFGNLVALNEHGGIASTLLKKTTVDEMEKFFDLKIHQKDIAGSNIVGACIRVNNTGFVANPRIDEQEFEFLEKTFKVKGFLTTANYGDKFVGNDMVINNKGVLIGPITTTHEMARIDEAFRSE